MSGFLVWITGLSGTGKTTLAKMVSQKLKQKKISVVHLDGDDFREILGNDLGYNDNDRLENAKRISKMCKFFVSQNVNVICSTMSLYKDIHIFNRQNIKKYLEIYIEIERDELLKRDPKGLYKKVLNGETSNVVGVDLPYDIPEHYDLLIENTKQDYFDENVDKIIKLINEKFII